MTLKLRYLVRYSVLLNLSLTVIVSSFALQVQISQARLRNLYLQGKGTDDDGQ